ncbi:unnamed protein product [Arabis nemorensis]|uniref:Uncharacterized protein n=1 Tax=Arabis nemorensis TaxID=586526 RepID=A0A565CWD4_9BRAS|nr:unnamed protein product [Arabis nemorensis]
MSVRIFLSYLKSEIVDSIFLPTLIIRSVAMPEDETFDSTSQSNRDVESLGFRNATRRLELSSVEAFLFAQAT